MSTPAPNTIANRADAMAKFKAVNWHVEIEKMKRSFARANVSLGMSVRSMNRGIRQMQRDHATRPVSDERREIQAIGRREMAAAVAEFRAQQAKSQYPSSINLPPIVDGQVVISGRDPYRVHHHEGSPG